MRESAWQSCQHAEVPDSLPLHVAPGDDESLLSLVERVAAEHGLNVYDLRKHVGSRLDHVRPDGTALEEWAAVLRVPAPRLESMTIVGRYDGTPMLPEPLTDKSYPMASARHPIYFRHTNYSPERLTEDGWWRLAWRSPWTFADLKSDRFLLSDCPGCGQPPQADPSYTRGEPVRPTTFCGNRVPSDEGPGSAYDWCHHPLTLPTGPPVDGNRTVLDLQQRITAIGEGTTPPPPVFGQTMEPSEWMRGFRALVTYAHPGIRPDDLTDLDLPDASLSAVAELAAADAAVEGNVRGTWPPRPPALLAALTAWADYLLAQGALADAASGARPVLMRAEQVTRRRIGASARSTALVPNVIADLITAATRR